MMIFTRVVTARLPPFCGPLHTCRIISQQNILDLTPRETLINQSYFIFHAYPDIVDTKLCPV